MKRIFFVIALFSLFLVGCAQNNQQNSYATENPTQVVDYQVAGDIDQVSSEIGQDVDFGDDVSVNEEQLGAFD